MTTNTIEQKDRSLYVRVDTMLHDRLLKEARASNLSLATYIRLLLINSQPLEIRPRKEE